MTIIIKRSSYGLLAGLLLIGTMQIDAMGTDMSKIKNWFYTPTWFGADSVTPAATPKLDMPKVGAVGFGVLAVSAAVIAGSTWIYKKCVKNKKNKLILSDEAVARNLQNTLDAESAQELHDAELAKKMQDEETASAAKAGRVAREQAAAQQAASYQQPRKPSPSCRTGRCGRRR